MQDGVFDLLICHKFEKNLEIFRENYFFLNFAKSPKIFKIRENYSLKITKITNFCFLRRSNISHSCFFLTVYFHSHPTVALVFYSSFLQGIMFHVLFYIFIFSFSLFFFFSSVLQE